MTSVLDLEGEEVRVSLGGGSFLSGVVQQVNDDRVIVRGRTFPLSAVQLREDVEQMRKSNIDTDRRLRRAEQEAKEAAELALKGEPKIPILLSRAVKDDIVISTFVTYLQSSKYRLYLSCKPELTEVGESEYIAWSGESLPEDAIRTYENAYGREWFLTFEYSDDIQYPVSVVERGTGGGQGEPVILHKNGRCELCYWQIIEQLVRAGLRA